MQQNISFLLGITPDPNGRAIDQYLAFRDDEWEGQHDIIQMAFPNKTQSKFHPNQPFLPASFDIAGLSDAQRQQCRATIILLLQSYLKSLSVDFTINGGKVDIHFGPFSTPRPYWTLPRDHNTLRLTRILECLAIFDILDVRNALYDFLVYTVIPGYGDGIGAYTLAFWVAAKENKLHLLR